MQERDDAFSLMINDPDLLDSSEIVAMENVNDVLFLIFKENSIYKLLTADSIDPKKNAARYLSYI